MEIILKAAAVHKTYLNGPQPIEVLKGIDLSVNEGELIVIMGPSGVGKSTLLHIIGGLDNPTKGTVLIDNINMFNLNDKQLAAFRNHSIGFIFQFHHLLPEFSALENVMIPAIMYHNKNDTIEQNAIKLLTEVGLKDRLLHKPGELSGGEQQRVAVARALINKPRLVLADEPTGNLDKKNSEMLYQLIIRLNKEFKHTFIIVTHNEMMSKQADRVIELEDGKIKS
jgi:lipoprotein-releasing system ATP-binding protein